jgi:hypothetical protein
MLQDTKNPDHYWLIAEWADVDEHARILQILAGKMKPEFLNYIVDLDKGAFIPKYAKIVSSTPQDILNQAAE